MKRQLRKIDGYWRRFLVLLLGRPTYAPYFTFLQKDHRLDPDPRALKRATAKGFLASFGLWIIGTIAAQVWFAAQIDFLRQYFPPDRFVAGPTLMPGSAAIWTFQLLFHLYPNQQLASYVFRLVEIAWSLEIVVCVLSFGFMMFVYSANAKDRYNLSMAYGSARYSYPDEHAELMPRHYDIWEGFNELEVQRRRHDQSLYDEREDRIRAYAKEYLKYEQSLIADEDTFSPLVTTGIADRIRAAVCLDERLTTPIPECDITPTDQPQIAPGTPKYTIDPRLLEPVPPLPTPAAAQSP